MRQSKFSRTLIAIFLVAFACTQDTTAQNWNPNHAIGSLTGKYHFTTSQTPDQLVVLFGPGGITAGQTFRWEWSYSPVSGFQEIPGTPGGQSSYTFPGPITETRYYRRKTTTVLLQSVYSNTLKIQVVSINWEDLNYMREHAVTTTGITTWQQVDNLPVGQKLQTTTYLDRLGRRIQVVEREVATTLTGTGLWGDAVNFFSYDAYGRQPIQYLPYTTTTESGKYKTTAVTEQATYHTNVYNETSPFTTATFDNSPVNRVTNVKRAGAIWAASAGSSGSTGMNEPTENVQRLSVDYVQGNPPVSNGAYPTNSLYKITYTDVDGKQVIEYLTKTGQTILKKVQLDNTPSVAHSGWLCTYFVYDDFGAMRYQLQPEAVKYLDQNGWSFAGVNGSAVLNGWCFQYNYDNKRRLVWKKAPGATPSRYLYDNRNRMVFMQDGNQSVLGTPQWTAFVYDELDRQIATVLYNTTKTVAALQTDINNAAEKSVIVISNASNAGGGPAITLTTSYNPISATDLNNPAVALVVTYSFFDNYSYAGVKTFNTGYTNLSAYSTSDPNVMPIATSLRTASIMTGGKTRVLGSNTFLAASYYYDERGSLIQTSEDNVKSGVNIVTNQYHFDGRQLSSCTDHTTPGTGYTNFKILTKNTFDKLGRPKSVLKQFGTNTMEEIASFDYDDIGRLKTKRLDPGYTGGGNTDLESLNYSYNINNQITGINKDYALKNPANYNKWGHYFGLYLGYDNKDNVFTGAKLNGQLGGAIWNTMGDDAQRRYEYSYDNANRLVNAAFTEQKHPGDGWANNKSDYSVSGTSGKITYDLNGNIMNMLHKGVIPGTASPINIDNLSYSYTPYTNKLSYVTDQMTMPAANGLSGDFKDGANAAGSADYEYDDNGNVIIDLNKNAQSLNGGAPGTRGISYNFLDKPELIRIVGKGTVRIVYSASGEKLQRTFIPEAGGASVITTYINEFIYQESATVTTSTPAPLGGTASLAFIGFGEGRIRVITPVAQNNGLDLLTINGNITLPNSKMGVYDYFITDFQQNVRMILTEEVNAVANTATMENSRVAIEEPIFGQTGVNNEVASTRFPKPSTWTAGDLGLSVSRLGNIAARNLGPNTLQKVMAGDQVTAQVKYFYESATGGNNPNIPATILSSLSQSITNGNATTSLVKGNATAITAQLNGTPAFISAVTPAGSGGNTPLAFLTILFFDERFNFIEAADGGVAQQQVASSVTPSGAPLGLSNIKAPKNGYVLVYLSNRSDQHVFFDNFLVNISRGQIIEENHYYAYGLRIAAISSRKQGDVNEGVLKNNYLYNAKEFFDDADLNWYDYGFRYYDPQIGRFPQLDPLTDKYPFLSSYQYASCDPASNIDLDGLEGASALGGAASFAYTYTAATTGVIWSGIRTVSTSSNIALNSIRTILSVTSIVINTTHTTLNVINANSSTVAVGGTPWTQGWWDAFWNANLGGVPDLWGAIWGDDPLDQFDNDYDKLEYVQGRLAGDAAVVLQAIGEAVIAKAAPAAGAAGGPVGVGAGILAGLATYGHSAGITALAAYDAAVYGKKLIELQALVKASGPRPSTPPKTGETAATISGKAAHKGYNPGSNYKTNRSETMIEDRFPDAIDFVNKIVRELKPNNKEAIRRGEKQVKAYLEALERRYGGKWKAYVDTWEATPNGGYQYNISTVPLK